MGGSSAGRAYRSPHWEETMGVRELATGMRGVINTAALAQKENGLSFKPFNQYLMGYDAEYDEWLGKGMCTGLSIKYLACVKNGEEFTDIVNTASMNDFTFTKDKIRID